MLTPSSSQKGVQEFRRKQGGKAEYAAREKSRTVSTPISTLEPAGPRKSSVIGAQPLDVAFEFFTRDPLAFAYQKNFQLSGASQQIEGRAADAENFSCLFESQ